MTGGTHLYKTLNIYDLLLLSYSSMLSKHTFIKHLERKKVDQTQLFQENGLFPDVKHFGGYVMS